MNNYEQIVNALRQALPESFHLQVEGFARLLSEILQQHISSDEAREVFETDEAMSDVLSSLSGQQIHTDTSVISIERGGSLGDMSMGDVAQGNIIKLNINFTTASTSVLAPEEVVNDFNQYKKRISELEVKVFTSENARNSKIPLLHNVTTPLLGELPPEITVDDESEIEANSRWRVLETNDDEATDGKRRELYRIYEFRNFDEAFHFMNEVAQKAIIPFDHHPRWQNTWNRVEFWLTTFNIGYRISGKDKRLAERIENVWQDFRKTHLFRARKSDKAKKELGQE